MELQQPLRATRPLPSQAIQPQLQEVLLHRALQPRRRNLPRLPRELQRQIVQRVHRRHHLLLPLLPEVSNYNIAIHKAVTNNVLANVQTFTGTLGGAPPPVISSAGTRPFSVNGDTFVNAGAALQRSCSVSTSFWVHLPLLSISRCKTTPVQTLRTLVALAQLAIATPKRPPATPQLQQRR